MRPIHMRVIPTGTLSYTNISLAQTPAAGGIQELTITGAFAAGGVATFTQAGTVDILTVADERSRVFVITGTSDKGYPLVEAVRGVGAALFASSILAFRTVTSIKVDANTTGAVSAGWAGTTYGAVQPLDYINGIHDIGITVAAIGDIAGTAGIRYTRANVLTKRRHNGTIQHRNPGYYASEWDMFQPVTHDDWIPSGAYTADSSTTIPGPVTAVRWSIPAGPITGTGDAEYRYNVTQASGIL